VNELFASGRIVDLILMLMTLETLTLVVCRRVSGRGIDTAPLLVNMAAGGCLLLALRAALTGAGSVLVAAALAAAGVMHVLDVTSRWNRPT
jgi:hypothetical protein